MASMPPLVVTPSKEAGEKVPKQRLAALKPEMSMVEQLRALRCAKVKQLSAQSSKKDISYVLGKLEDKVTYEDLTVDMMKMILRAEGIKGMSNLNRPELVKRLSEMPVQQKPKRKAEEHAGLYGTLNALSEARQLTPALCAKKLTKENKLKDGYKVVYIIPPSLGGVNHMDNLCVLPATLTMPTDAATHCKLMAALLPDKKIIKAVTICRETEGNNYIGSSAPELTNQANGMCNQDSLFPWNSSKPQRRRTGPRAAASSAPGGAAAGAAAPTADGAAAAAAGAAAAAAAGAPANEPPPVNGAQADEV